MSRLSKDKRYTVTPGKPGIPASPGSPEQPGYFIWSQSAPVCELEGGIWVTPAGDAGIGSINPRPVNIGGNYVCRSTPIKVWIPTQPAMPATAGKPGTLATLQTDFNLGWNAGAVSIEALQGDGHFQFSVKPSSVGVIAGLTNDDPDGGYANISHGVYCSQGLFQIIENGVQISGPRVYDGATEFRIMRVGSRVAYLIDGTAIALSQNSAPGAVNLDVSLYSADDSVHDASIERVLGSGGGEGGSATGGAGGTGSGAGGSDDSGGGAGGGDGIGGLEPGTELPDDILSQLKMFGAIKLRPLMVSGSDAASWGHGSMAMRPLRVFTVPSADGALSMEPMSLRGGDTAYADGHVSLQPLSVRGREAVADGIVPSYGLALISFPPMATDGEWLTGEIGGGTMAMRRLDMLAADYDYGEGELLMEPPVMWGEGGPPSLEVTWREMMYTFGRMGDTLTLDLELLGTMGTHSELARLIVNDAVLNAEIVAGSPLTLTATMHAALMASVGGRAGIPVADEEGTVWVVNDESAASTTYEGFGFNSFCRIGEDYYGAKLDGLYRLGGATDNGAPIRSALSLGMKNFGTTALKSVSTCYLGVSASGTLWLKVIADGQELLYRTERTSPDMETQRIKLGRGLRAGYLTFEIYNGDGADFELESVEFEVAQLSRRI